MKALLSLLAVASLSCAPAVEAGSLVDVGVVDRDTGVTLPAYPRDGRYYVIGVPGHRYGVRLTNHSGGRVLAVLSVDGVNAVSGETANPDQTGYVLDPYQSTEIDGWRKNMNEVAQFNFTALSNSYAGRTGRPDNVGVIGVAAFREKPPRWSEQRISDAPRRDVPLAGAGQPASPVPAPSTQAPAGAAAEARSATTAPAPAQSAGAAANGLASAADASSFEKQRAAKAEEPLGTGHGAREYSTVTYANFVRNSSRPDEIVSVWYDSYHNLVARGVIPPPPLPQQREPQPFPNAFVPDPAS
jgi:hypothetical protein